jgi:hypothetical protein
VQVCLIVYADSDDSGGYSGNEDTIYQVVKSKSEITYEVENTPYINRLNPKQVAKFSRLKVIGNNFGPTQTTGNVHVGRAKHYNLMVGDPATPKGKIQDNVKLWSNTKVTVNFRVHNSWKGTKKWVWVVKDGKVSNKRKIQIDP